MLQGTFEVELIKTHIIQFPQETLNVEQNLNSNLSKSTLIALTQLNYALMIEFEQRKPAEG